MIVVVLNGPPGSGKDSIAEASYFEHKSVKAQLLRITFALFDIDRREWDMRYDNREENLKEVPWDILPVDPKTGTHHSQRSLLIYISEDVIKPHFGQDYFGDYAASSIKASGMHCIFSDGGFKAELESICKVADKVLLVHLSREGCEWGMDSRSYLEMKAPNLKTVEIANNGSVVDAVCKIMESIG